MHLSIPRAREKDDSLHNENGIRSKAEGDVDVALGLRQGTLAGANGHELVERLARAFAAGSGMPSALSPRWSMPPVLINAKAKVPEHLIPATHGLHTWGPLFCWPSLGPRRPPSVATSSHVK